MLNTQVQIFKCILSLMLSLHYLSPPGSRYKRSANVGQTQPTMYHPRGVRILVIHSHFHSWGGSKHHGSDGSFSNVVTLSPSPWSAVKCYSHSICYKIIIFGSFCCDGVFCFLRMSRWYLGQAQERCLLEAFATKTECIATVSRKMKGQVDFGRAHSFYSCRRPFSLGGIVSENERYGINFDC